MEELGKALLNIYVLIYIVILGGTLVLMRLIRTWQARKIATAREKQGLTLEIITGPDTQLDQLQKQTWIVSVLFLCVAVMLPFLLAFCPGVDPEAKAGLAATFAALMVWVLVSATDIAKSFLGGLAFKIVNPLNPAFQLNDRVSLKGYSGKVVDIGIFHVRLNTADDDQVCIPTMSLWNEVLVSANAGSRSSLCVMEFYLAPDTDRTRRKLAEDIIWDAVQTSVYFEPAHPLQIYCVQKPQAIVLQAKAYVASTYKEPDFKSEVTNTVLDQLNAKRIHLAGASIIRGLSKG